MRLLILLLPFIAQFTDGYSIDDNTPKSITCEACNLNEIVSEVLPCCEPTCENDCSQVNCPNYFVYKQACVCREGFVRHDGECIAKSACPEVEEPLLTCPPHEELQPIPACCEPTCSNNCAHFVCRAALIHKPTCVCERGYVRHEGRCVKPDQCPTCGPYAKYSNCTPCCETTCDLDCAVVLCLAPCSGKPTCLCQPGYVKHNGDCIKEEMCPRGGSDREQSELAPNEEFDEDDLPYQEVHYCDHVNQINQLW